MLVMPRLPVRRAAAGALVGGFLVVPGLGPLGPVPPAAADGGLPCVGVDKDAAGETVEGPNVPYDRQQIGAAREVLEARHRAPGEGVAVVLVDSGVVPTYPGEVTFSQRLASSKEPEVISGHATIAAGIVAGPPQAADGTMGELPIGLAPAVDLYDVRVYDQMRNGAESDPEIATPTAEAITGGLEWVLDQQARLPAHTIVLVPSVVARSDGLDRAIDGLERAGFLVVAPAGDRPGEDDPVLPDYVYDEGRPPGEDAVDDVWPAGYESVLTAGVAPDGIADPTDTVLQNSAVDLAAPTNGGVSYGLNGKPCVLEGYSSDWAAAMVAGAAALVWSAFPDDDVDRLRSRLLRTADGNGTTTSPVTGHGVVQPLEALQRRFEPRSDGLPEVHQPTADEVERAVAPEPRDDVLASTRRNAVWWGLLGGAALVVAMVLRPVLARRRRP